MNQQDTPAPPGKPGRQRLPWKREQRRAKRAARRTPAPGEKALWLRRHEPESAAAIFGTPQRPGSSEVFSASARHTGAAFSITAAARQAPQKASGRRSYPTRTITPRSPGPPRDNHPNHTCAPAFRLWVSNGNRDCLKSRNRARQPAPDRAAAKPFLRGAPVVR